MHSVLAISSPVVTCTTGPLDHSSLATGLSQVDAAVYHMLPQIHFKYRPCFYEIIVSRVTYWKINLVRQNTPRQSIWDLCLLDHQPFFHRSFGNVSVPLGSAIILVDAYTSGVMPLRVYFDVLSY